LILSQCLEHKAGRDSVRYPGLNDGIG